MSNIDYIDWNHKKIKAIIDFYGYEFFNGKRILDLGCHIGEIGNAFSRLNATVICVDAREEHLNLLRKKYPHLKTVKADLDHEWPFGNEHFDIILDLSIICHLRNYENHLKKICQAGKHIILESEACDSDDPNMIISVAEHKSISDWAFNGTGSIPSAANIEKILIEQKVSFKRLDQPKLNSGKYIYDWKETNSNTRHYGRRRMWFIDGKGNSSHIFSPAPSVPPPMFTKPTPTPFVLPDLTWQTKTAAAFPTPVINQAPIPVFKLNKQPESFRVALCISGHLRGFEHIYTNLNSAIISPLNCDVFISTWDSLGAPFRGFDAKIIRTSTNDYMPRIKDLFKPKKFVIEPFIHFPYRPKLIHKNYEGRDLNGMLSMFYKIKSCNELKNQYEKENDFIYDVVIRYRSDLVFTKPPTITPAMDWSKLYLPGFFHWAGFNDQFAFGSASIMNTYSGIVDHIEQYIDEKNNLSINPEMLMKYHILKNSLVIADSDVEYFIRRDS